MKATNWENYRIQIQTYDEVYSPRRQKHERQINIMQHRNNTKFKAKD